MSDLLSKILIIQTAHIGDVVLALPVAQRLRATYPDAEIHFLLRNGNQNLLENHPAIDTIHTFDRKSKISAMFSSIRKLRREKFDLCINLQRFFSSGLIASLSGAKEIRGFEKNPLSPFYSRAFAHKLELEQKPVQKQDAQSDFTEKPHEVERNLSLLEAIADIHIERPRLYPSAKDEKKVEAYQNEAYYVIAPASVWSTKQLPAEKWIELINRLTQKARVLFIGAATDHALAEGIIKNTNHTSQVENLCGILSFLQSTALIAKAKRTYTNDSAALHFATAVNAPVSTFFLSTVPEFGFYGLSDDAEIIEVKDLECRPCGLHGYRSCPKSHFLCASDIKMDSVLV